MYDWTVYSLVTLIGGAASLITAATAWRGRDDLAARYVAMLALACGWWGSFTAFEMASTELQVSLFWSDLSYIGIVETSVLLFCFTHAFVWQKEPRLWQRIALHSFAAITLLVVFTNPWHRLFMVSATIDPVTHLVARTRGVLFYAYISVAYVVYTGCVVALIISGFWSRGVYRSQRLTVAAAVIFTPAVDILSTIGVIGPSGMEWSPTALAVSCAVVSQSMRHQRLFDLRPILRENLLDVMGEAVVLIDDQGRIADFNQAMVRIAPIMVDAVGVPLRVVLPRQPELCDALERGELTDQIIEVLVGEEKRVFEARVRPLPYKGGRSRGQLAVLYDITDQHRLEAERDALLGELRTTLARAQELGGLLPICSNCKRIRDDQNLWHEVEAYIGEHSLAELSAAICPECQVKLAAQNEASDGS